MKNLHYLFIIIGADDTTPQTGINNNTLFPDFELAFDQLKSWALHEFQVEDIKEPKPGPYRLTIRETHLEIWECNLPTFQ